MPQHRAPLGQNFLRDNRIEKRIVEALRLRPSDAVLEIGAGPGNMTALIAERVRKLIAVELDARLAEALHRRFDQNPNVEIWQADILKVSLSQVAQAAAADCVKVFGNLPYYITSPCLMHLFDALDRICEIVVMVQQEVAERIVAQPGTSEYGLLSVTCRYYTSPEILFSIPPEAFRPPPKVHSALVRLKVEPKRDALGITDEAEFWKWIKAAFAHKRKTLVNNWKSLVDPDDLRASMEQLAISPRIRAEALSIEQLAGLYQTASATPP